MSGTTWLALVVVLAVIAYVLWRRGQAAASGDGRPAPSASARADNGYHAPNGAGDLLPETVTPERVRALPLGAFIKLDPEGPDLPEELQVTGRVLLRRATTDVDIMTLSGRLEDWLAAYYETGQTDTFLQLQDHQAHYSVLTEVFVGGWGYYPTLTELASDETERLRDIADAESETFEWQGESWRKRGAQTYKVQAQGESLIEDGTLLRVLAAGSADGRRSLLFLDQWSGHNSILTGTSVRVDDIVTEII